MNCLWILFHFLSVTSGTILRRGDLVGRLLFFHEHRMIFGGRPVHVRHLGTWPEVIIRISMAVKTPRHAQRLFLFHHLHLPDIPVTADTTDPRIQVGGMAEIDIIGEIVHAHPFERLPGLKTLLHRFDLLALPLHDLVTVHAGLRGRDVGHR